MTWYFYNNRGVLEQEGLPDAIPVGVMVPFITDDGLPSSTPSVPTNWLLCNGAVYPTATYPELAAKIAAPGVPGVNFTLPNLQEFFMIGAGATPVKGYAYTPSHDHGAATDNAHSHTNTHYHTLPVHNHYFSHQHAANHTHGAGSYALDQQNGSVPITYASSTGAVSVPKGPGSGNKHAHGVTGSLDSQTLGSGGGTQNATLESIANPTNGAVVTSDGAGNSGGQATGLGAVAIPVTSAASLLPPYLNVYFIIKAVDLSGTYV